MNTQTYATELVRNNGIVRAVRIAESCMKATAKDTRVIFTKSLDRDTKTKHTFMTDKHLTKLNTWWTQVFFILKKKLKNNT